MTDAPNEHPTSTLTLVPPRRLGSLLREAREARAMSLEQLAQGSRFDVSDLAGIEQGRRVLDEAELDDLVAVYGIDPGEVVPERAQLVVDLSEHRLMAGGEVRTLAGDAPTADEVLASYLSLVYTLRHADPGTPLVLRDADVSVLSRVLELAQPDVETRLHELMVESDGEVSRRVGLLRGKVLLPLAGIVVAATAVGALLLVQSDGTSDESPSAPPPVAEIAPEIGPAVVQTQEGVVVIGDDTLDIEDVPEGGAGLINPQVATPNPDGSVNQTDRQPDEGSTTTGG